MNKWKPGMVAVAIVLIIGVAAMISRMLTSDIDTSGIKPAEKVTTQSIEKDVQDIQNNPKIPDAQKPMIIAQIRSRLGPQSH